MLLAATAIAPSTAQERWSLDKCIQYAIENNINIKLQEVNIEQNEISLNTARMDYLPEVDAGVNQRWSFGRGLTADNTYGKNTSNTSMGVNLNMSLFSGFRRKHTIDARRFELDAAMADLGKAKEDIGINVASLYLQVLYADEMRLVAQRQYELSSQQLIQQEYLLHNGKASESDVAQARSRVAQDQQQIVQAENDYNLARLDLSQLLELPSPDNFAVEQPDTTGHLASIASIEEIYADALRNKAIIKADEARIQSAEKTVSIAKSGHMPSLSLSADVSTNYYKMKGFDSNSFGTQLSDNLSKNIMLNLNIPIFSRFSTRNEVRTAKTRVASQNLQLEADKKSLYKEVQQAYYNAKAAESKYSSSLVSEESAQTAFNLMSKKYDNGKANQTEYNQSRTEWTKAISDRIQAKYEYIFRAKILEYYRGI